MADFTNTSEEAILDWWGNIGSPTRPSAHWISLFTVIPSADDGTGGTECSNSGYARQSVTWTRSAQTLNPTSTVTFGPAGEAWTEVVAFGVHSLVTGGSIYAFKGLTTSRTLGNGDSAEFATSDLSVTLD
jgi:hypothetical protein